MNAYAIKAYLRGWLYRAGLMPRKHSKLSHIVKLHDINVVFDVGANNGQTVRKLLADRYQGRAISFEPLKDAYAKLEANASAIPQWQTVNAALGDCNESRDITVAGNSQSSSFLKISDAHLKAAPITASVGTQQTTIHRFDAIVDDYCQPTDRIFVKLDVPGFEHAVFTGVQGALDRVLGWQMELAVDEQVYEGETNMHAMMQIMADAGYTVVSIESGFGNSRSGRLLQADVMWIRTTEIERREQAAT